MIVQSMSLLLYISTICTNLVITLRILHHCSRLHLSALIHGNRPKRHLKNFRYAMWIYFRGQGVLLPGPLLLQKLAFPMRSPLSFMLAPLEFLMVLIFFFVLSQGIHFDPASAQTLRLEFARTNSRVSPKQQSYIPHQSAAVNVANAPGPLPPARNGQCKLCQIEYHISHFCDIHSVCTY